MQNGDHMQEFEFEHTCTLPISEGCQDTSRQAMYLKQSTFSRNLTSPIPEGTHSSWNFQPGSFIIVCYGLWLSTAHSKAPIKTKASIKAETIRSHETSPKRPEPTNWMRATVLSNVMGMPQTWNPVKPVQWRIICLLFLPGKRHLERSTIVMAMSLLEQWSSSLYAILKVSFGSGTLSSLSRELKQQLECILG